MARNTQKKLEPPAPSPTVCPTDSSSKLEAQPAPLASLGQEPSKVPPHPASDVIEIGAIPERQPAPVERPTVSVDDKGIIQIN